MVKLSQPGSKINETSICFHLAFPVYDFAATKIFYLDGLGCTLGRETSNALILNLRQNQIVGHRIAEPLPYPETIYPRHFGLIFPTHAEWEALHQRAQIKNLKFFRPSSLRHPQQLTEHYSFFLIDPTNNLLEFKFYTNSEAIFGAQAVQNIGDK